MQVSKTLQCWFKSSGVAPLTMRQKGYAVACKATMCPFKSSHGLQFIAG